MMLKGKSNQDTLLPKPSSDLLREKAIVLRVPSQGFHAQAGFLYALFLSSSFTVVAVLVSLVKSG